MIPVLISPGCWEELSSSCISSARETRLVKGIKWCFKACCAETNKSHSNAIAFAKCGFVCGTVRTCLLGRRRGRVSRWICSCPSTSLTLTSFQNRLVLALPPPLPAATARRSWPFFRSSACFRRRATRESTCSALGTGTAGTGPDAVIGATVAGFDGEVCRHLWVRDEGLRREA